MKTKKPTPEKPMAAPDQNAPHKYPRRVLLAVTGLSPQVVTETLYALVRLEPPFVPTEIRLLTTAEGARQAQLMLLSENPGWFHRLRRDYDLPEIAFDGNRIEVIQGADGTPLADIRTVEDNERLADALTAAVRTLTGDSDCALHVSIAGGRKTMGFYAGYALSLYGRPQDRLSHVLVSEHYESNRDFYYPTPKEFVIHGAHDQPLDARLARIGMAEIPFVRLRNVIDKIDRRLLKGNASFSEVVASAQRALDPATLELDWDEKCVRVGEQRIPMQPARLAFLSWLARRAKDRKPGVTCPPKKYGKDVPNIEYAADYLRELARLRNADALTAARLRKGMTKGFFDEMKSKVNGDLRTVLGPEGARQYGIVDDGARPKRHFFVALPPERIRWAGEELDEPRKLAKTQTPGKRGL